MSEKTIRPDEGTPTDIRPFGIVTETGEPERSIG
jgi:hypothetical protein